MSQDSAAFDIAILIPAHHHSVTSEGYNTDNYFLSAQVLINHAKFAVSDLRQLVQGSSLEVMGYPLERSGELWRHEAALVEVVGVGQGGEGGIGGFLLVYNVDATPGTSGAAILSSDPNLLKPICARFPTISKLAIGLHLGYDPQSNTNYGLLFTKAMDQWIKEEVERGVA